MASQVIAVYQESSGTPPWQGTTAAITPAPAGMGIPTKYFFPGLPGFDGCGFVVMLKRARRLAPAIKNKNAAIAPSCVSLMLQSANGTGGIGIRWKPQVQAN